MLLLITTAISLLFTLAYLTKTYLAVSPSIPGPFLARLTDLWRFRQQTHGTLRASLLRLHAQHGPVVRYGARSLSIADPAAIDVLYGSRAGFVTADSYRVLVGISNGKEIASLVSTRDEGRHGRLRRAVAGAFTVTGVAEYEGFVDATVPDLLRAVRRTIERGAGGSFDLAGMLMLYSMDSASRMAFSESLGCLESGEDVGGSIALIRDRSKYWGYWSGAPWLERLLYRNAWALRMSKGKTPSAMVSAAAEKLKARLSDKDAGDRRDMLSKFIESHRMNPDLIDIQGIVGLLMSTISGAGDTTAATMTAVLYYLLKEPEKLQQLRTELEDAGLSKVEVPDHAITSKLPYLAAVIKEGMRLFPTAIWPLERLVPFGGMEICGHFVPEGTSVGVFIPSVHLDHSVFGEDAAVFRPERWLEAGAERLKKMEQAFLGFSRGRRRCLGQYVAILQMKKVIPSLILSFDLKLVDEMAELDADMSAAVVCLKPFLVTPIERR